MVVVCRSVFNDSTNDVSETCRVGENDVAGFVLRWGIDASDGSMECAPEGWSWIGGLILLPLGLLLGGMWTYGGDPGVGILLVPIGALLMLFGFARIVYVFALIYRRVKNQK